MYSKNYVSESRSPDRTHVPLSRSDEVPLSKCLGKMRHVDQMVTTDTSFSRYCCFPLPRAYTPYTVL